MLHGCRQTAKPTFLESKEAAPCMLRHLVSRSGRNIHNQILRLTSFFNTRPKQENLEVTDLNDSKEMKTKVSMKLK